MTVCVQITIQFLSKFQTLRIMLWFTVLTLVDCQAGGLSLARIFSEVYFFEGQYKMSQSPRLSKMF